MFCPKCGTQNPETGKFCRKCGTDLATVSDALSGKTSGTAHHFGMISPVQPMILMNRKGKPVNWESAIGKLFMGLAFLTVAIVLGVTGRGNGWWFWMLMPAFGMLGSGVAQYMQLKTGGNRQASTLPSQPAQNVISQSQNAALPPNRTEYVDPESRYKTGDLVPPSVTDNTTRHLEMNSEGETMTLPKK
ncbi:MAG TPA: zinc-ribbon domain-containing protein [Pyrinomonadaceae bacterium]|jgi:hypothetical protein